MKLTPLDIRHREFKRGMRGYADHEVDEFLDEVADEFERVFKDNIDVGERVEALEAQVSGYRRIEETLQKTLISAQASAEELKKNSTKEAQLILHEAELKGRQMVNEAYSERQAIEQSMAKLKSAEQDFRFKFRQLLEGFLKHLEDSPTAVAISATEEAAQSDFARHAEAVKEAITREEAAASRATPEPAAPEDTAEVPAAAVEDEALSGLDEQDAPRHPDDDAGPETVASAEPEPEAEQGPVVKDRILFGETDDLLADVDTGVNENEFKW